MDGPDAAEDEPGDAAERFREGQLGRDDEAERGDHDEPEDAAGKPDPSGSVLVLVDDLAEAGDSLVLRPEIPLEESSSASLVLRDIPRGPVLIWLRHLRTPS